ncbi:hypothetical protein [Vibrio salinus]|uniref:hypothetical protein n=1 Tax=Vibrio salinus TaxID=2899784 RepID=UPI001E3E6103|nr:hypothetical protein [Vibrio salinus]MCE0494757.1 hypothetical protein [Vibrio salinus]
MPDTNIGQILQAFHSIESKIQEQNVSLKMLSAKVEALENQNKQLVQLIHQLRSPSASQPDQRQLQFQNTVTQSLRAIEDKSKKTLELVKTNSETKKRAWP